MPAEASAQAGNTSRQSPSVSESLPQ